MGDYKDGSVNKLLALQAQSPKFNHQNPLEEHGIVTHACNLGALLRRQRQED